MGKIFRRDNFKHKKEKGRGKSFAKLRKHERLTSGYYVAFNTGMIPQPSNEWWGCHTIRWIDKYLRKLEKKYHLDFVKLERQEVTARTFCCGILPWAPWLNYHRQKYLNKRMLKRFSYLFKDHNKIVF